VGALDRLARGVFARCDTCGTEIDDERLRIAPETSHCPAHRTTPITTPPRPSTGVTAMAPNPSHEHFRDHPVDQPANDVADQHTPAEPDEPADPHEIAAALTEREFEADPADVADQQRVEAYDGDEHFRG
jgi:hypothetical protein